MKNVTEQLNNVLQQDMDRKEFLRYAGAIFLGIIGVNKIIGALGKLDKSSPKIQQITNSYGNSPYGR